MQNNEDNKVVYDVIQGLQSNTDDESSKKVNIKDFNVEQAKQSLLEAVPQDKVNNDLQKEVNANTNISNLGNNNFIKNVNNQVLINFLSPEISNNEKAKRIYKIILISTLLLFIIAQFCSVYIFTNKAINYTVLETANSQIVKELFLFISAYITSIVVELIAILKYIVQNVFDTSIAELIKLFKDSPEPDEKNTSL